MNFRSNLLRALGAGALADVLAQALTHAPIAHAQQPANAPRKLWRVGIHAPDFSGQKTD